MTSAELLVEIFSQRYEQVSPVSAYETDCGY